MDCTFNLTTSEIFRIDGLPANELATHISECLCANVYKAGSPDLTGIGVIISFGMQLVITVLFWIVGFLDGIAIPEFWNGYVPRHYLLWVSKHHGTCLWTQMIVTFALCLAGFIRQTQRQDRIGVYESSSILSSIPVSYLSLVLTTISFFPELPIGNRSSVLSEDMGHRRAAFNKRAAFFYVSLFTTSVFGLLAVLTPFWAAKTENILEQCAHFADGHNLSWKIAAIRPVHGADMWIVVVQVTLAMTSTLLVLSFWFLFRLLGRRDQGMPQRWRRVLVSLMMGLSIFLLYEAFKSFRDLLSERQGMNLLWKDQIGQNIWGIGQIAAPFAWAPLIVDLVYAAVDTSKQRECVEEDVELTVQGV
ncbi:hypothetical protein BKA64DRAFT_720252 [Cadophora sp. MPI-SDFR-AT-0126]|nr:hypothetical protein BKA64DRAFT_720252 [Leotiomycetes sp. MPI-SDFR-AT-0126]